MDDLDRERITNLFLRPMGMAPSSDEAEALFSYLAQHGFCGVGGEGAFLSPLYRQELQQRIEGFVAGWQAAQQIGRRKIIPFVRRRAAQLVA